MALTLKQLRYALALAEAAHFGRAAERCHVTQPALSQQILALEADCGTALFDRLPRSVRPTPFGREFIERARRIIEATDELTAFAAGKAGAPTHPVRFGLIPTVAPYLLPEIFPALRRDLPAVAFTISENRTDALLEGLFDGSLDIALIATDPPHNGPRLTRALLFDDAFVLASSDSETITDPVDLSRIAPERMLLLSEGHCFRDQAIAACALEGEAAAQTFAATSLSTIVQFVANGQGVTLLPQISLEREAADPRLRIRALKAPAARTLSLIWREATPFADLFAGIAETIRAARN